MQAWQPCPEYSAGDIVTYVSHLWEAKKQSAGKEPNNPNNTSYWKDLGEFSPADGIRHDDTLEKHGTSPTEFNHLSDDEADAALNSYQPSASNPFVTASEVSPLHVHIGDFVKALDVPSVIYDALYDEDAGLVVAAGDNAIFTIDPVTMQLTAISLNGAWRGIAKLATSYIVVGKDIVASGTLGALTAGVMPSGSWKSVAVGNSKAVAVADGRVAVTSDGTSWTSQHVPIGFGDDIAFNEAEGLFFSVGRQGCKTSAVGASWTDTGLTPATWRAVARGYESMVAVSGHAAFKPDGEDWIISDMPIGGWEDIAHGGGYLVAAGNSIVASSPERALSFAFAESPDFIYTSVIYGCGKFWLLGSAVVTAPIVNIGEALENANNPNADNPFATKDDLDGDYNNLENKPMIAGVRLEGDKSLSDFGIANQADADTLDDKVTTLNIKMATAETGITDLDTRVGTLEATSGDVVIGGLETRIAAIEVALTL